MGDTSKNSPALNLIPPLFPEGGGGPVYPLTQVPTILNCSTSDGTATSAASKIKSTDDQGPNLFDWRDAEYSGVITRKAIGNFGLTEDSLFSVGQLKYTVLKWEGATNLAGFVHNHPRALGDELVQRYPSDDDFAALQLMVNRGISIDGNPALWLLDQSGTLRKFFLSERSSLAALDDEGRKRGDLLAGREVTTPCTPA